MKLFGKPLFAKPDAKEVAIIATRNYMVGKLEDAIREAAEELHINPNTKVEDMKPLILDLYRRTAGVLGRTATVAA